jgi:hypothetical protein
MSFALDLKAFAEKTSAKANAVVRKVVIDVGTSLVMKSPVGDPTYWKGSAPPGYVGGRFRANWQYGLGSIDKTTTERVDASGQTTISAIVGTVKPDAAGEIHYITNSLPYAMALEEGHSWRQAPNGMVNLTVLEFQPIVDAAAKEVQ